MADRIRQFDWSKTPLGAPDSWSPALKTMLQIMLANRFPCVLWWGSEYIQFYNDAYRPYTGDKHPHRVLGRPGAECWSEIWNIIGPLIDRPFRGGPATWDDDILLEINRFGFMEETHFTIAYSPVPDESAPNGIGGVLATVHEITEKVVGERRVKILRDLGARAQMTGAEQACTALAETLEKYPEDVPFALLYLLDADGKTARLAGAAGVRKGIRTSPLSIELSAASVWPLNEVVRGQQMQQVENLRKQLGADLPRGPWSDPPHSAVVAPVYSSRAGALTGFLVLGISSRLKFDDAYQSFVELMAGQIASAIANARAYEEERKRAEALAELDRAKTAFFSNVSHEFRTPLTLMLGPVADALHAPSGALSGECLTAVHRNGMRLLKLVNTILDFARIEAGRVDACYEPVDLAGFTAELASSFETAIVRAGLNLVVSCEKSSEPAYIDRDMWDKIVLNLISNAFKFTWKGEVRVHCRPSENCFELIVEDTGIGIPAEDMPHIFERFHRVKGANGRTLEGTGIGLALVHELVRLHQGTIRCESVLGEGTRFTIQIPKGSAHLPQEKIGARRSLSSTAVGADPYIQEALRWLPSSAESSGNSMLEALPNETPAPSITTPIGNSKHRPMVLVADDNADMREYLARLLSAEFEVETVTNGQAALDAIHVTRPDLIVSDVMMPVLDGFGLLKALRENDATRTLPFILLSARAGEEAKIEGLQAGADDYLVKPFHARELIARIASHLELARIRKEAQERERELRDLAEQSLIRERQARQEADKANRSKDEFLAVVSHELRTPLTPVVGWVRMLKSKTLDAEKTERGLSIIDRNIQSQVKLIDDLLDISRIVSNKIRLEFQYVGLAQVIEAAIDSVRHAADSRQIRFKFSMEESVGPIWGDPERLKQIFSNLLTNAVKFSKNGDVIAIRLAKDGDWARVDVVDKGIGIDASFLPRVFERFSQFDSTTTRVHGGLGIGLSVVRQLTELHGGEVRVVSDGLDKGSIFTVKLPTRHAVQSPSIEGGKSAVKRGHEALVGKSVLVVDDETDAREYLRFALERGGAKVVEAGSVTEAIACAATTEFDVVVTDIGMPDEDGFALLRRLRAAGIKTPAIAVTAFARPEDRWHALSKGFHRHIAKPVDPDELCTAVCSSIHAP